MPEYIYRPISTQLIQTAEPLFWLAGAGHEIRDSEYRHDCAIRNDMSHVCLQLTLAGCGFHQRSAGSRRSANPARNLDTASPNRTLLPEGSAFFDVIPSPIVYGWAPESAGNYELVYVSMKGPAVTRWHQRITRQFSPILNLGRNVAPIRQQMLAIAHQYQTGTLGDRYQASGTLYQLLMTLLSTLTQSRLATEPRAQQAIELISRNAHSPSFDISQLAADMGCSREHLSRQFRAATGVSPSDYLVQHRVRLAARLLRQSNAKLDVIARQSGFASANYLCRIFSHQTGVTPGRFRAQPWIAYP